MPYTDEQLKKLYDTYSTASQDKQQKVLDTLLSNSGENYGQIQSYFASQINAAKNSATTPTTPTSAVDRANPVPTSGTPIQQPTSGLSTGIQSLYQYGDTGGASTAQKNTGTGVATPSTNSDLFKQGGMIFGKSAEAYEAKNNGYLQQRNDAIATDLWNQQKITEKDVSDYLKQYEEFNNYELSGQQNTIQAIYKRLGELQSQNGVPSGTTAGNSAGANVQTAQNTQQNGEYWQAVNDAMNSMFGSLGYGSLADFRRVYGDTAGDYLEQYYSDPKMIAQRNKNDPLGRKKLEEPLGAVAGQAIALEGDKSRLNMAKSSVLSQFTPESQQKLQGDLEQLARLETQNISNEEIASNMGISLEQLNELVLLQKGLGTSKIGEWYELSDAAREKVASPYERDIQRNLEDYEWQMAKQDQDAKWVTEDFQKNLERQNRLNEINMHNLDVVAGLSGVGFSKRGMEGIQELANQAKWIIDDMFTNYDRTMTQINDIKIELTRAYERNDEDLQKSLNDALTSAKNTYIANTTAIQQQYGLVSIEGQTRIMNAVQSFITTAESIYDNAFQQQQTSYNNLVSNRGKIQSMQAEQFQIKQYALQDFQQNSMNKTPTQAVEFAKQNGLMSDVESIIGYMQDGVVNTLNGIGVGLGYKYAAEVETMLKQGNYSPAAILSKIVNYADVQQAMQSGSSNSWTIEEDKNGNLYKFSKNTGETIPFNGDGGSATGSSTTKASPSGQLVSATVNSGNTTKKITLDSVAMTPFQSALSEIEGLGENLVIAEGYRDQIATIKNMASQFGIVFNEANPSETAAKLRAAGHQVADHGLSNHEIGMAIDLYSKKDRNGRLLAPTDEQVAILNKYGFYQTAGSGDMGHFDYVGTQQSNDGKMKEAYLQRLKSGSMTNTEKSDIQNLADKEGRLDEFIEADKKGMKTYMTDGQFKVYNNAIDDFRNSEEAKEYKEIATNYEKVKSNLSQSGNPYADIGAIFGYMKMLDPTSVVREGEFATAQNAASIPIKIVNMYNKALEGTRLTSEQKKEMLAVVENMIKEANTSYNLSYDLMKRQLIGAGIDESLRPENLYSKLFNEGSGTTGLSDRFK